MLEDHRICVIIPAFNEEAAIGKVLADIPTWVDEILVIDGGSSDRTAEVARTAGARVVVEPQRGYGRACLTGIAAMADGDVVVFLDGDYSDHPAEMATLAKPILRGDAGLVIGSRVLGERERGALTPQQVFGNWLACRLIRLFWGVRFTDLGPFRAITVQALDRLEMTDDSYGWTVEMQIKAARQRLGVAEVPVSYRPRIGVSKISGTVRGMVLAGSMILGRIVTAAAASLLRKQVRRAHERLIVLTRYPEPGRVKTRLIPALGPDGAAALHDRMVRMTIDQTTELHRARGTRVEVRYTGTDSERMASWIGGGLACVPDGGGDLGERLARASGDAFAAGCERVVLIGTDCPDLSAKLMSRAFSLLASHDAVIGPALDGGYYLLALSRPAPGLFRGIDWGSDRVLAQTRAAAEAMGLRLVQLPVMADIDRPEDLALLPACDPARREPAEGPEVV